MIHLFETEQCTPQIKEIAKKLSNLVVFLKIVLRLNKVPP